MEILELTGVFWQGSNLWSSTFLIFFTLSAIIALTNQDGIAGGQRKKWDLQHTKFHKQGSFFLGFFFFQQEIHWTALVDRPRLMKSSLTSVHRFCLHKHLTSAQLVCYSSFASDLMYVYWGQSWIWFGVGLRALKLFQDKFFHKYLSV